MKTHVTGRQVEITPDLRATITRKLAKVERILNDSAVSAQVVLTQARHTCCAEVVVHARGDHMLHGEDEGPTWRQAIGGAVDKIDQQAHTLKSKWDGRRRATCGNARQSRWSAAARRSRSDERHVWLC